MRETSTDFLPEGYVREDTHIHEFTRTKENDGLECDGCGGVWRNFKLTEEEYQWLISLCCRSG